MTTVATVDLKAIHEIYKELEKDCFQYGKKFFFLARCLYLDLDHDSDIAMKTRPYGGRIEIDNSSLDKYFKSYNILLLHAIFHDDSGFVFECSAKDPVIRMSCPVHYQTRIMVRWHDFFVF